MAYISSNNNRWYCQLETSYGQVPSVTGASRFPAGTMSIQQKVNAAKRKDKTGTRTFAGLPAQTRKQTNFSLTTYMTTWANTGAAPGYGPLFEAALGQHQLFAGGTSTNASTTMNIVFSAPHGLIAGQAITFSGEIRFVVSVIDAFTVLINAPFSNSPAGGTIGPTITYLPTTELPSVSVFDYWTPSTAVQRLLCGCGVDQLEIQVNSDYQNFGFKGMAQDVLDSSSFTTGMGQLTAFPIEPVVSTSTSTVVPGNLGQAWLGTLASRFYTLTSASVILKNNLDARANEFGSVLPREINPGPRSVQLDFGLYGQDDAATVGLYQAARQRSPITAGFQLGQTSGQLFGMYMKSVVPELPDFSDKDVRLQWQFQGSQAQGLGNDELAIAFG
jgi:hypothetical protein